MRPGFVIPGWVTVALLCVMLSVPAPAFAERTEPVDVAFEGTVFRVDAPSGMRRFAEQAAEVIATSWPTVAAAAGAPQAERLITVSVERELNDWFERRGVAPRSPEWAAGLAMYDESAILVRTANPEWASTLRHELAHMAVDIATGGVRVPRWFNEGFAIATAEQWSIERAGTMVRAGLTGNFYAFEELGPGFPAAGSSAGLAYAQSFHFVRYVRTNYGEDVFVRVMSRLREGARWAEAFEDEVGVPMAGVEAAWVQHVTTRYKWAPALGGGGGAWGAIAALSLFAWRRSKRRAERRLAALAREEATVWGRDPDDEVFG